MPLDTKDLIAGSDIWEHLPRLFDTAVKINAQFIVEIGVCRGQSTKTLLQACKETGGKLISIDKIGYGEIIQDKNWIFINADSKDLIIPGPIDLLLIDSSHTYEDTARELTQYALNVRPGGFIFLHDSVLTDVKTAINEFLMVYPTLYEVEETRECNGMVILRRK